MEDKIIEILKNSAIPLHMSEISWRVPRKRATNYAYHCIEVKKTVQKMFGKNLLYVTEGNTIGLRKPDVNDLRNDVAR